MKKQILNLGKALNKAEQKQINGGVAPVTKELCDAMGGFWGLHIDGYWCCTIPGGQSYC